MGLFTEYIVYKIKNSEGEYKLSGVTQYFSPYSSASYSTFATAKGVLTRCTAVFGEDVTKDWYIVAVRVQEEDEGRVEDC